MSEPREVYRVILLKKHDEELGEHWGARMFLKGGGTRDVDISDLRGVHIEVAAAEEGDGDE